MNNDLFQQARSAYVAKDYETALTSFTDCLQDCESELLPGETGLLYHQIGNCLVKLHDPNEAIHAYSQASTDVAYDAMGSVNYNLGNVYASQHDYEDAIGYFKAAAEDAAYPTPYKAHQGLGSALLKLGKSAEAGAAFRAAALDPVNPDPTKALLNLGVCFMALDRPLDAIASYESALQFDMPAATRNRLFANMGQAYVASGKMGRAVRAFESALADKTYVFNDAANVDYQRAVAAVAAGIADEQEQPEQELQQQNDLSGLDVPGDGVPLDQGYPGDVVTSDARTTVMPSVAYDDDEQFFNGGAGGEFQDWADAPKKRRRNRGLKIVLTIVLLLLVIAGGGLFAYTQGYGWPMKDAVVSELFSDPDGADVWASNVDDAKKQRLANELVTDDSVEILGEAVELTTAHVYVQAQAEEGGEVPYDITLVREGIGWKVENVALYFTSQHTDTSSADTSSDSDSDSSSESESESDSESSTSE